MTEVTKIRGKQIRLADFIQNPGVNDPWNSTTLTASQSAILDKINASITGVTGAMVFKGAVSSVPSTGLNPGQVYVWSGNSNGSITASNSATGKAETVEKGDTLLYTTEGKWLVIQYNIAGAMTEADWAAANFVDATESNGAHLEIDTMTHKIKVVRTAANGSASAGANKALASVSQDSNGKITSQTTIDVVSDVTLNGTSVVTGGKASLLADGTYDPRENILATKETVANALDNISGCGIDVSGDGHVTATTQNANNNSTNVATTAYADRAASNAVGSLNLQTPISNAAGKTVATISESNGVVGATFQDIAITTGQVTDFKSAFKSVIGTYLEAEIAEVPGLTEDSNILACFMNGVDITQYCSCESDEKLTIAIEGIEYDSSDVIRVLFV